MKEQFLRNVKGQPNLPRWFSSIFKMIQSPNAGSLIIQLPDNRKFIVESKKPGANAYIVVKNEHFFSRLVREGQNGFSESYMDCLLYTSPSPRDGLLSRMPSSA